MLVRLLATVVMLAVPMASADGSQEVRLRMQPSSRLSSPAPVLDRLEDGDVLRVFVSGGAPGARATVRQCTRAATGFTGCRNVFPVQFDNDGSAAFQYQISDPGDCGVTGSCAIAVDDHDGSVAYALTVFGAPAPLPPDVVLTPAGPYEPGDTVRVDLASLPPGAVTQVAFCTPGCNAFGTAQADADGRATASVVIEERCSECFIAVLGGGAETFVPVEFSSVPAADYSPIRLVVGLSAAAAMLLVAWWIIASVNWRPPSEASTPEFDAVEL